MNRTRGNYGTSTAYDRFYAYDEKPKTVMLNDFSGGVSTKEDGVHTVVSMMNMESAGGALVSLPMPIAESFGFAAGEISDHCYADGIWLFRKGRSLYARTAEGFRRVGVADMFSTTQGAIHDLNGDFYVMDGAKVWRVGRDFSVALIEPSVPVCFTDVGRDGLSRVEVAKPKLFSPYIDLILSDDTSAQQILPPDIAYDPKNVKLFYAGSDVPMVASDAYTYDGASTIRFLKGHSMGCRIRLKLMESANASLLSFSSTAPFRKALAEPNAVLSYMTETGDLYLLTWQGRELWLMRHAENFFDTISESEILRIPTEEIITALVSYDDGYLLFTDHVIKKMQIVPKGDGTFFAKTEIFKQDFGSDMPGSICSFDDNILFADSRGGVFYINKFGISDRDGSRKVSENIENGAEGFFSHTAAEYRAARGICAFGKYYLTVGTITYIWDYGAKRPASSQTLAGERSMVWSLSDGFADMHFLQTVGGRLYLWDTKNKTVRYLQNGQEASAASYSFMTAAQDLGTVDKKILTSVGIRYRAAGDVFLKLFLDGKELPAAYRLPPHETFTTEWISAYAKPFEKVALLVFGEGDMGMEKAVFQYLSV